MSNVRKKFIPVNGYVLMRKKEGEEKIIKDGIHLRNVDSSNLIPQGIIAEIDTEKVSIVKPNDEVVFIPANMAEFVMNGEEFLIISSDNILGKVEQEK